MEETSKNSNLDKIGSVDDNLNKATSESSDLQNSNGLNQLDNEQLPPAENTKTLTSAVQNIEENGVLNQTEDNIDVPDEHLDTEPTDYFEPESYEGFSFSRFILDLLPSMPAIGYGPHGSIAFAI